MHVAGNADAPDHRRRHRPDDAVYGIVFADDRPDLILPRGDDAGDVRRHQRYLGAFVRVGKGTHGYHAHAQRLYARAARRAVFDDDIRHGLFQLVEEGEALFRYLPPALAAAFRAVAADAEGVVIVDLYVRKTVFAQERAHFFAEIGAHVFAAEIKKPPVFAAEDGAVAAQHPFLAGKDPAVAARVFKLEPYARHHAAGADAFRDRLYAVRKERFALVPIPRGVAPAAIVRLVPARIYHEGPERDARDAVEDLGDVFLARDAPRRAVLVEQNGHALFAFGHAEASVLKMHEIVADVVHAAVTHAQVRPVRAEAAARLYLLAPVPGLVVGKPAGEGAGVLLFVYLHLPAVRGFEHGGEDEPALPVAQGGEGEISPVRHTAALPEPFALRPEAAPARVQPQRAELLLFQAALAAPCAGHAHEGQPFVADAPRGGVEDAAHRKTLQAFQHLRPARVVAVLHAYGKHARCLVVFEQVEIFVPLPVRKQRAHAVFHLALFGDMQDGALAVAHGDALRIIDEGARAAQRCLHHAVAAELRGVGHGQRGGQQRQPRAEIGRFDVTDGGIAEDILFTGHFFRSLRV